MPAPKSPKPTPQPEPAVPAVPVPATAPAPAGPTPPSRVYSAPIYAYPPTQWRPYNPWAIVSIAFAASTVMGTWCMGGLVAVIAGHIARSQIKRSGEQGGGLALAGLIVGYVSVGLVLAFITLYVLFILFIVAFAAAHPSPSPSPVH